MLDFTLLDAVRDYISHLRLSKRNVARWIRQKEKILLDFRAWSSARGLNHVENILPKHLDAYLETRAARGEKESSMHIKAVVIRHMARWTLERGHVKTCPLATLKLHNAVYAVPEIPDFKTFVRLIDLEKNADRRDLFAAALLTGLRRGELFAMRWQDVHLEDGYIHIRSTATWTTKTKRARTVPVCHQLRLILEARQKDANLTGPWMKLNGKPLMQPNYASAAWRRIAKGHRLDLRFHSLRHAFCTHILQDLKADPISAQTVMGHTTMRTTQLYMHPNPDTPRRIAKLLDHDPALKA